MYPERIQTIHSPAAPPQPPVQPNLSAPEPKAPSPVIAPVHPNARGQLSTMVDFAPPAAIGTELDALPQSAVAPTEYAAAPADSIEQVDTIDEKAAPAAGALAMQKTTEPPEPAEAAPVPQTPDEDQAPTGHNVANRITDTEHSEVPAADAGGGGGMPPTKNQPPASAEFPEEGESGPADPAEHTGTGEQPARMYGQLRPALREAVTTLKGHGVLIDELLGDQGTAREILADLIDPHQTAGDIGLKHGIEPRAVFKEARRIFDRLYHSVPEAVQATLPQPTPPPRIPRDTESMGVLLDTMRRQQDVTVKELSQRSGTSPTSLFRIFNGTQLPAPAVFSAVASSLGLTQEAAADLMAQHLQQQGDPRIDSASYMRQLRSAWPAPEDTLPAGGGTPHTTVGEQPKPSEPVQTPKGTHATAGLTAMLKDNGITHRQAAERVGVSPDAISSLLRGSTHPRAVKVLQPLLEMLGLPREQATAIIAAYNAERRQKLHVPRPRRGVPNKPAQ